MLILANIENGIGAAVILNSVTIYHEDDDKGYDNSGFSAESVSNRLAEALKLPVTVIGLTVEEAGGDEWNFETVNEVAVAKYEASLFIQIPVDLKPERAPLTEVLQWSASWDATQRAAKCCKARGLDAATGHGKAFGIFINGHGASAVNKDHKKIVKAMLADVQRRIDLM